MNSRARAPLLRGVFAALCYLYAALLLWRILGALKRVVSGVDHIRGVQVVHRQKWRGERMTSKSQLIYADNTSCKSRALHADNANDKLSALSGRKGANSKAQENN